MAGVQGFEPRQLVPKTSVLPLHHTPLTAQRPWGGWTRTSNLPGNNRMSLPVGPHPSSLSGTPCRIRTYDPWLRRPMLYPAELRAHENIISPPRCLYTGQSPGGLCLLGSFLGLDSLNQIGHSHGGLASQGVERDALLSDSNPSSAGEVQVLGDRTGSLDVVTDTVTNHLGHPSLVTVPVHLEPLGVPLVQVVGSDEVEGEAVGVGALTFHHDDRETGLRVSSENLVGGDCEGVRRVSSCSHDGLRFLAWGESPFGRILSFRDNIIPLVAVSYTLSVLIPEISSSPSSSVCQPSSVALNSTFVGRPISLTISWNSLPIPSTMK